MIDLQIIRSDITGEAIYIRDSTGVLCSFRSVVKWPNQQDRYERELAEKNKLAESILSHLESNNGIGGEG